MKIISYASCIILCFDFVHSLDYEALIFDRTRRSLIKLPKEISNDSAKSGKWATACPPKGIGTDEGKFNKDKSLYKNALFVREIYTEEKLTTVSEKTKICKRPLNLSLAVSFERTPVYYEFGYDINFNSIDSRNFDASDRTKYISIKDLLEKATNVTPVEYLETHPEMLQPIKEIDVIKERPVRAKLTKKSENEMGFIWIPLFKVISLKKQLQRIEYEIHRNNISPMANCQDYALGKELFEEIDVNEFYATDIQKEAFKPVDIPPEANKECKKKFSCFEKTSLIPLDQYRFGPGILKCSNMTTVPIWKSVVKDLLQKVDEFLYTLSRVSGRPLRVTAGVYENLQLPTKRNDQIKNILLKHNKFNLHVPEIVYKMVRIKSNNTCKSEDPGCWSGVLIVIHNYPNFSTKTRICLDKADKSEELGWEEITYKTLSTKGSQSKNIYVCSIEKVALRKIGLEFNKTISINDLSLKNFPYNENDTVVEGEDMKTRVFNELKRVAEGGKLEVESDVIERPYLADDDFELVTIKKPTKRVKKTHVKLMNEMKEDEEEDKKKEETEDQDEDEEDEEDLENDNQQEKGEKKEEMEGSASENDGGTEEEWTVLYDRNDEEKTKKDLEMKTEGKKEKDGLEITPGNKVADNRPDALNQSSTGKQKENLENETGQDVGKKDSTIKIGEGKVEKTNVQDRKDTEK